jgi:hypothetical protein
MRSAAKLSLIVLLVVCSAVVCTGQGREVLSPDGTCVAILRKDCTLELRDAASGAISPIVYWEEPSWN